MTVYREHLGEAAGPGFDGLHQYRGPAAEYQSITPRLAYYTHVMKTQAFKQALETTVSTQRSAAHGAMRKRSAPRSAFSRSAHRPDRWDPKISVPSSGTCTTPQAQPGESIRVFPLSNWTELDIWQYIRAEAIPIVPLYFAAERPVVRRDGARSWSTMNACRCARARAGTALGPVPHARLLPADQAL